MPNGHQNLQSEIEGYQAITFYDPSNMSLIAGSGPRSGSDNERTKDLLLADLALNRMPLVVLRYGRTSQHVVAIKRSQQTDAGIAFYAYDSNQPAGELELDYATATSTYSTPFYASSWDGAGDVGLFVVDEGQMDQIQDALYKYYSQQCGR